MIHNCEVDVLQHYVWKHTRLFSYFCHHVGEGGPWDWGNSAAPHRIAPVHLLTHTATYSLTHTPLPMLQLIKQSLQCQWYTLHCIIILSRHLVHCLQCIIVSAPCQNGTQVPIFDSNWCSQCLEHCSGVNETVSWQSKEGEGLTGTSIHNTFWVIFKAGAAR